MATIGNINIGITASTKGLEESLKRAEKKIGALRNANRKAGIGQGTARGRGAGRGGGGAGGGGGNTFLGGGKKILGPLAAALGVRSLARTSDAFTEMNNKVGTVTDGLVDQKETMAKLAATANRARAPVTAVAAVFQRFAFAGKNFNTTNEEALKMVETLFKIGVVGGVTSVELRATLIQLSQGFGKGRLDGIELTSVMEQMAPLAQLFADRLGVPIGRLKELGAEGKITSKVIKDTLTIAAEAIDAKFASTKFTVSQNMAIIQNSWTLLVGEINKATGATERFKEAQEGITFGLDFLTEAISNEKSPERQFFEDVGGALNDNIVRRTIERVARLQSATDPLAKGAESFFGPNNPLLDGKVTEANSGALLKEMAENTKAVIRTQDFLSRRGGGAGYG
jgi:tape measure domain-containing protein